MNKSCIFPLTSLRSNMLGQVDIRDCDTVPDIAIGSGKVVEPVTRAFLNSEPVRVAMCFCLRQHIEELLLATIQLLLRCCLTSEIVHSVLCGLPISFPVASVISGGGDETFVHEIFSIISLCGSHMYKEVRYSLVGEANGSECQYINLNGLALHSCLLLATIAQSFNAAGRNSAALILTSSLEKQRSRLSSLACLYSVNDRLITSFQPHRAAAMLAFASILLIEIGTSTDLSVSSIAMPLVPSISTLFYLLKMNYNDELVKNCSATNSMLSLMHGVRDGCIGLLKFKLRWGGLLALKEFCAAGFPHLLMDLLGKDLVDSRGTDCMQDLVGLSPVGVLWAVSCLSHCLSADSVTFRELMLEKVHIKCISDLISCAHLKFLLSWGAPGGGRNGVREIIDTAIDFLAFPFVALENSFGFPFPSASMNSGLLLNASSSANDIGWENGDITNAVKESLEKYVEILLELGVPILVLNCVDTSGLDGTIKPVAFLAKMINCKH